jgi:hypothetical protein
MKLRLAAGAAIVALTCFASPAGADEAPVTTPAASSTTETAPAAPTTEPPAATSKRTVWPWVLMGTGVALIVTATVLEINAVRQDDKRESDEVKLTGLTSRPANDPEKVALQSSIDEHSKSATNGRTAALIIGTAGFLTVAGSVVLWFVEGSRSSPSAPPAAARLKPTFTPTLSPTYAGASFGASF